MVCLWLGTQACCASLAGVINMLSTVWARRTCRSIPEPASSRQDKLLLLRFPVPPYTHLTHQRIFHHRTSPCGHPPHALARPQSKPPPIPNQKNHCLSPIEVGSWGSGDFCVNAVSTPFRVVPAAVFAALSIYDVLVLHVLLYVQLATGWMCGGNTLCGPAAGSRHRTQKKIPGC